MAGLEEQIEEEKRLRALGFIAWLDDRYAVIPSFNKGGIAQLYDEYIADPENIVEYEKNQ